MYILSPTPTFCTYIGVIFAFFFLFNCALNCVWKRDHLMLKVKVLFVKAEEVSMVFPDRCEEATPRKTTYIYIYSLLLQWTLILQQVLMQLINEGVPLQTHLSSSVS